MKFVVKDQLDREYDVDAPDGTDIDNVIQIAERRLGIKVSPVEKKEAPAVSPASNNEAERAHRESVEAELAEARAELKVSRKQAETEMAEERGRHAETHKARMKALDRAEAVVMDTLRRALDDERRAREAAERRDSKPVIVENKIPEAKRVAWTIRVTERDANGFVRAMEAVPK